MATLLEQNCKKDLLKYYFVIYLQILVVPPLLLQMFPWAEF